VQSFLFSVHQVSGKDNPAADQNGMAKGHTIYIIKVVNIVL